MNRARRSHNWPARVAALIALVALVTMSGVGGSRGFGAVPGLRAADPPPNALLAEAPGRIALTFAEPIAPRSVVVRLRDASGGETPLPSAIDEANAAQVIARPPGMLGSGDYTVLWSVRLAQSGELLSGAYPFRAGVVTNPGAAALDSEWPAPGATLLRWLVFLGTALAGGGFAWARLIAPAPGAHALGSLPRRGTMTAGALVALLATLATPLLPGASDAGGLGSVVDSLRGMPLGWWIQLVALAFLGVLCLSALVSGRAASGMPAMFDWVGLGAALAALTGLSLTSHAAHPLDRPALAIEIAHQWSTALWASGLLYLSAGWREMGSDVARFRVVRWVGGVLLAFSVGTGVAAAWGPLPDPATAIASRYAQALAAKTLIVLVILGLGLLAMILPRRSNAVQASGSLAAQGVLAVAAMLLSALLALLALPGAVAPATLAGVELVDVVRVDPAAFTSASGMIHLLAQPAAPGTQSVVVRLTDASGVPLAADPPPVVEVVWEPLFGENPATIRTGLQADRSGSLFSGSVGLPIAGWWAAEVIVSPPGGIAARAQFWLVLPDPNVTGHGPAPSAESRATSLFARGLDALASLRSVRSTRRVGDGSGVLTRSEIAMRAATGDRPAAYTETILDLEGSAISRQTMIGDERWLLEDAAGWTVAEPAPFPTPASLAVAYRDARGFRLGPREEVGGEICQVVTFSLPPGQDASRPAAWGAWWVGLASGEVRREAIVSTRRYLVAEYRDFDADVEIAPPAVSRPGPAAAPAQRPATPIATPRR